MITPSHVIYAWALARSRVTDGVTSVQKTAAFVVGAITPDVPVYVFFIVEGLLRGRPHEVLWDQMYFESWWSILFTLSHSMIIWPLLFTLAVFLRTSLVKWFALSGIIHICTDFLVHTEDAYKHFWPLTEWRFISPFSYWDRSSYGDVVGLLDALFVLGLLLWLLKNTTSRVVRVVVVLALVLYSVLAVTGIVQVWERF